MFDEKESNKRDQEKRDLLIEVLDKGLLGLREAGIFASFLAEDRGTDLKCNCKVVCGGCRAKCGCPQLQ